MLILFGLKSFVFCACNEGLEVLILMRLKAFVLIQIRDGLEVLIPGQLQYQALEVRILKGLVARRRESDLVYTTDGSTKVFLC